MNKELIKKYKAEFDHWLDGGKLLQKQINLVIPTEWEEFAEDWDWPIDELVVIINDEYVEFRKALAEGKTIQYKDREGFWNKIEYKLEEYHLEELRIKPEEPKFKVGDWVRDGKNIYQFIVPSSIYSYEASLQRCELWRPKLGEWCWVGYKLMKFNKLIKEDYSTTFEFILPDRDADGYRIKEHILERHLQVVEPFIGQLPSYLKE